MITAIVIWVSLIAFLVMLQIRNEMVYSFRIKTLGESDWIDRQFIPYNRLPPYGKMVLQFWIWDFNKFIPKGPQ